MARAPKICSEPGCPNLAPCATHQREPWRASSRRERLRTSSGSRQQRLARAVMERDHGVCHVCGRPGADEVDHVVPLSEGGADDFYNRAPIHSKPCHERKTSEEAGRARARA